MVRKRQSKTIVVTGGAGFIGSHLCEYYLKRDYKVYCVDNFLTGSESNIRPFLGSRKFKLLEHDVSKALYFKEKIDSIFHFASPASPVDYLTYPIKTLKVGSLGTYRMLGLAKKKKASFILASTSEVYGDPQIHPQPETYWGHVNPIGPRGVYDEAKRFSEALALAYYRTHKVRVRIGRIFNTYGPRMRKNDGRVVPNFIDQALKGEALTIYGKGRQTRSFCYINDLVRGFVQLRRCGQTGPINIGNPGEFNMIQLAKIVIGLTGSKSKIKYKPLPVDDPKVRCPNITLAKKVLKWQPKVPLKEGLSKTIDYFKNFE